MKKHLKHVVALALILILLCTSALAASYSAKVLPSAMRVYNSSKQTIGALKQGTRVTVTAVSGRWARIRYGGKTGYASLSDLMFSKRVKAIATRDTSIKFVTRSSYKQSKYYSGTLSAGTTVYVAGKKGSSALITNSKGSAIGYVSMSALKKQ